MFEKFGRTFALLIFLLMFYLGAKMLIRVSDPVVRRVSASLADALQAA